MSLKLPRNREEYGLKPAKTPRNREKYCSKPAKNPSKQGEIRREKPSKTPETGKRREEKSLKPLFEPRVGEGEGEEGYPTIPPGWVGETNRVYMPPYPPLVGQPPAPCTAHGDTAGLACTRSGVCNVHFWQGVLRWGVRLPERCERGSFRRFLAGKEASLGLLQGVFSLSPKPHGNLLSRSWPAFSPQRGNGRHPLV